MTKSNKNNYSELAKQLLGRTPRTAFVVKTTCSNGEPQVLEAEPVFLEEEKWKPFPTFLWLVCPILKKKVATLEQSGYVKILSDKLRNDSDYKKAYMAGHEFIVDKRYLFAKTLLPMEKMPKYVENVIANTTIAGSSDIYGVKCLHSHLAQELAYKNNPIGADVIKLIGSCDREHNLEKKCNKEVKI